MIVDPRRWAWTSATRASRPRAIPAHLRRLWAARRWALAALGVGGALPNFQQEVGHPIHILFRTLPTVRNELLIGEPHNAVGFVRGDLGCFDYLRLGLPATA